MYYRHLLLYFLSALSLLHGLSAAHFNPQKIEDLLPFLGELKNTMEKVIDINENKLSITPPWHPSTQQHPPAIKSANPIIVGEIYRVIHYALFPTLLLHILDQKLKIATYEKDEAAIKKITLQSQEVTTLLQYYETNSDTFVFYLDGNVAHHYQSYISAPHQFLDSHLAIFFPYLIKGFAAHCLSLLGNPRLLTFFPFFTEVSLLTLFSYLLKKEPHISDQDLKIKKEEERLKKLQLNSLYKKMQTPPPKNLLETLLGNTLETVRPFFKAFYIAEGALLYASAQYADRNTLNFFTLCTLLHACYALKGNDTCSWQYLNFLDIMKTYKNWINYLINHIKDYAKQANNQEVHQILKTKYFPELIQDQVEQYNNHVIHPLKLLFFKEKDRLVYEIKGYHKFTKNEPLHAITYYGALGCKKDLTFNISHEMKKKNFHLLSYVIIIVGTIGILCTSVKQHFFKP